MDENTWRLHEFARALVYIEKNIGTIQSLVDQVENSGMTPEAQWNVLHPIAQSMRITIRKPPEAITDLENLTMKEIMSRLRFRSCEDAICPNPQHCSECGLHGARLGDGHVDCSPPNL